MYFSISQVKNDAAAQLAVLTATEMGERMLAGEQSHIAFESAVATISRKTGRDTATIAAQLLAQDATYKQKAIKVGMEEIVRKLGGEDNAKSFFRQITAPKATIRFESVGAVRDDIYSAKNRAAVLAMKAGGERYRNPNAADHTSAEREFIEYTKSVVRTLNSAVENGQVDAGVARDIQLTIEEAAYTDQRPHIKTHVMALQAEASKELFEEQRRQLLKRYAPAAVASENTGPSLH